MILLQLSLGAQRRTGLSGFAGGSQAVKSLVHMIADLGRETSGIYPKTAIR